MTNIGARSGSRSRSQELRSPGSMPELSPCPERSWRRVSPLRLRGEFRVLSVLGRTEPAEARQIGAVSRLPLPQITRHTMQSNFTRNSLKTNDGHPNKVTHKSGGQCSGFSAVWMRRRREFPAFDFPFSLFCLPLAIPESRRSRPASDSLSGGII
jgi:hypothetical protein